MIKHNFKIGDKVKYIGYVYDGVAGKIGIITAIKIDWVSVTYNTGICVVCGDPGCTYGKSDTLSCRPSSIEHVVKVGQQLLFSFMK